MSMLCMICLLLGDDDVGGHNLIFIYPEGQIGVFFIKLSRALFQRTIQRVDPRLQIAATPH
jgi:hypothetical protein